MTAHFKQRTMGYFLECLLDLGSCLAKSSYFTLTLAKTTKFTCPDENWVPFSSMC